MELKNSEANKKDLNETVARKLGWHPYSVMPGNKQRWSNPKDGVGHDAVPNYSTDIAAAWEILESLPPHHGASLTEHLQPPYGWTCQIVTAMSVDDFIEVRADTAPEAICRAFLKLP